MPTQLLVNVLSVGPLGAGASVTVTHGLRSNDQPVRPTLIQPNLATPIIVVPGSVNSLTATFQNPTAAPLSAVFRFERGYSPEVDADTVGDLYWAGAASGGGGGAVNSVGVTAPIVNTGTATDPIIGVSNALAGSTGVVQLAAGLGGAGTTAAAPKLDMDHATSGTLAALRGGTGLAGSGGVNDIGKVLMGNGAGGWSASSISVARTYYVAVNGSDTTGDGSVSKPFATIGAAQAQANLDLAATDYAQIVVGPGTYVGNVTLSRARTLINGAGGRVEAQASRITGQVLVNPSGATSKTADVIYLSGFFVQPALGAADAALRLVGANLFQFVATDCYFTTVSSSTTAFAVADETTNASRPRLFLQDCVVSIQTTGPTRTVGITNADTRIFRSQVGHGSSVVSPASSVVVISSTGTLWADSTIFEAQTAASTVISCIGAASATTRLMLSNCSVANTLSFVSGGVLVNTNNVAFISQTTFNIPSGSTYAVSGTGTLVYANLTFLPLTQTALQPTLVAATETHGTLLLPSLGAGMLVKATASSPVTVQALPVGPGLVPVPAGSPSFVDGTPVTINNLGALAAASALTINTAPAIGLYVTIGGTGYIRVAGEQAVTGPLVAGTAYYLASGGGLTSTAPSSSGNIVQYLGRATSMTTLFVSPATIVVA